MRKLRYKDELLARFPKPRELSKTQKVLLNEIEYFYISQNLTSRELCAIYSVPWSKTVAALLCKVFPKGMGQGGARKGAGIRKK